MVTLARAREVLQYNAETGVFTWRASRGRSPCGATAGTVSNGYLAINVDGRRYYAHRLAWLLSMGAFPLGDIDHFNGNKLDNRLTNLRDVSRSVNLQNQDEPNGANPHLGVHKVSAPRLASERWRASITLNGATKHLGCFASKIEAQAAYLKAKALLHATNRLTNKEKA